jgi:hypothetical protein
VLSETQKDPPKRIASTVRTPNRVLEKKYDSGPEPKNELPPPDVMTVTTSLVKVKKTPMRIINTNQAGMRVSVILSEVILESVKRIDTFSETVVNFGFFKVPAPTAAPSRATTVPA